MTLKSDEKGQPASETADIAEQIKRFHEFTTFDAARLGEAPVAVIPEGKKLESLKAIRDAFLALPARRRGTSALRDLDSFVEMVNRFKGANSAIFASPDRSAPSITAVFDYHPAGEDATKADWLKHLAVYAPPLSEEWKAWTAKNGTWMSQLDFASFIEERITDLIVARLDDPKLKTYADLVEGVWANPSDMVKLSRGLQVNIESTIKNAQTLNSGEISIVFEEIHKDGAGEPLKLANLFTIAIPVFYLGQLYRIAARLRYRAGGGKISWMFQLVRPDLCFDDAFNGAATSGDEENPGGIVTQVKTETQLPVFLGTPEA